MNSHKLYSFLCAVLISSAAIAGNYVIINQVMYDTPLNEMNNVAQSSNGEFIELYNAGADTVSLNGWAIKGGGTSERYEFHPNTKIPNGGYLILACRRGDNNTFELSDLYGEIVPMNASIIYQRNIILSNSGETLALLNAANDTIDRMYYDGSSHKTNPDRLYAENTDDTPGPQCVSLHRTWVEFDEEGKSIAGTDQWETALVSFNNNILPYNDYQEDYLFGEQSLPTGENYVLSVVPLDPTTRVNINSGQVSLSSGIRARTTLSYMDGLGREEQSIAIKAAPNKQDIVSAMEYGRKDKITKQWLPVAMETDGQRVSMNNLASHALSDYDDDRPFTEMEYESSAQGRIVKRYLPGEGYDGSHGATKSYDINSGSEQVRIYSIVRDSVLKTSGDNYPPYSLYKTTTTDEDGKSITVFSDQWGRTIMEKRADNHTYYVYDAMDRLRYVLPQAAHSRLTNGEYAPDNVSLRADAYYYRYDGRGNVIYKRLPGREPQYMVYDRAGQLVLSQDGNQRPSDKWTMCIYDTLGRLLAIREVEISERHEDIVTYFADKWHVSDYGSNPKPLVVNYYDDYSFLSSLSQTDRTKLQFVREPGFDKKDDHSVGLQTGMRIYNLSEDGNTATAYYYNADGRIIQSRRTCNGGGYLISNTEYLFDGSIAQQLTIHEKEDSVIRERYRYTYDHVGRALNTQYQLNNDAEITLSSFSYDSIGRLVQNLLYQNQDATAYSYDMRNRLKTANNKHFSEELFYADHPSEGVTPCFNGNISAIRTAWTDTANTYIYAYDAQNRLLSSKRLTDYAAHNSELFGYDEMGNITSLKRFSGNRMIDDLDLDYGNDGHQLLKVTDQGHNADLYSTIEYHNAAAQTDTTMFYDTNGNLIRDMDRGITAIRYNILNLPDTIIFSNGGQIVNFYDATGQKYKSITYTNIASVIPQQYDFAHYSFETDSIEYLVTEYTGNIEKQYSKRDTTIRIHNAIGYYSDSTYYHYIKDHLGNVCAVVNANADTVVQRTMYYASGVPMAQSWGRDTQPYMYNGKEFIEAHGWNTYDYGFRGFYATIGRFTSIDPLAEQTPWQSPYAYANNNFINNIDWMGLSGMMSGYNLTGVNSSGVVVYHDYSGDPRVILVDEDWKEGDPITGLLVGWEIYGIPYKVGSRCDYLCLGGGSIFSGEFGTGMPNDGKKYIFSTSDYQKQSSNDSFSNIGEQIYDGLNAGVGLYGGILCNELLWKGRNGNWYTHNQIHTRGGYAYSYKIAKKAPIKIAGNVLTAGGLFYDGWKIYQAGEIMPSDVINIALDAASFSGVGAIVAAGYYATDIFFLLTTGTSLGQRIDNAVDVSYTFR